MIGNPPCVRQEALGEFKDYFQKHFEVYHGVADLYAYFIERVISLLRRGGIFSYIVANKWMRANYGEPLRRFLKQQHIEEIIDFGDLPVFQKATTYPCILRIYKNAPQNRFEVTQVRTLSFTSLSDYVDDNHYEVKQSELDDSGCFEKHICRTLSYFVPISISVCDKPIVRRSPFLFLAIICHSLMKV